MNQVSTVGLDLAKYIFQLHGADSAGAVVFRQKLRRGQLLAFLAAWRGALADAQHPAGLDQVGVLDRRRVGLRSRGTWSRCRRTSRRSSTRCRPSGPCTSGPRPQALLHLCKPPVSTCDTPMVLPIESATFSASSWLMAWPETFTLSPCTSMLRFRASRPWPWTSFLRSS